MKSLRLRIQNVHYACKIPGCACLRMHYAWARNQEFTVETAILERIRILCAWNRKTDTLILF